MPGHDVFISDPWVSLPTPHPPSTIHFFILQILKRSCTEILSVEPSSVCLNGEQQARGHGYQRRAPPTLICPLFVYFPETFELVLRGNGFTLGRTNEAVVCSFIVGQQTFSKHTTRSCDQRVCYFFKFMHFLPH